MDRMSTISVGQVWESLAGGESTIEVVGGGVPDWWYVVVMRHGEPSAVATIPSFRVVALYRLSIDA